MHLIPPLCFLSLLALGVQLPAPTPGPLEKMAEGARTIAGQMDRLPAGRVSITRRVWVEQGGKLVTDARERHVSVFEGRKFHTWMESWTGRRKRSIRLYAEDDLWALFDGNDTYVYLENRERASLTPYRALWKYPGQYIVRDPVSESSLFHPLAEANHFLGIPWEKYLTEVLPLYGLGPAERLENGRMRMAVTFSATATSTIEWDPAMSNVVTRMASVHSNAGTGPDFDLRIEYTRVGEFILPWTVTLEREEPWARWGEELVFRSYDLGAAHAEDRFAVNTSELAVGTRVIVSPAGKPVSSFKIEAEERVLPGRIVAATLLAALLLIGWVLAIRRAGRASAEGLECARGMESSVRHG